MTAVQPSEEVVVPDDQRRAAKRQRVLKSGKIVFDDWSSIDCTIRDLSATGAKIRVEKAEQIPHKFKLFVHGDNSIRPAQMAWTKSGELGIAFTGPAKAAALRKF